MLGKEFNQKRVFAQGMALIGQVKEISVDPESFAVTDLIVQLEKEPARKIFGERFLVSSPEVKVPVSTIDKVGDVVSLKFGLDQLKDRLVKL
jgi:sporulation protein YlmC with PRC-barrel domain